MADRPVSQASCRVAGPGRLVRAVVAIVAAACAVTLYPLQPAAGVVAGAFSVAAAVTSITGRCQADWLAARSEQRSAPSTRWLPDAGESLDLANARRRSSYVHE